MAATEAGAGLAWEVIGAADVAGAGVLLVMDAKGSPKEGAGCESAWGGPLSAIKPGGGT